ncbi:hypothetical protein NQ314_017598 [Rhamnusium bicolor]|uniref:Uncharacterized protein n=1 Tax=Rhamnusium bicolor TaxID=1586634 RepID=A0AAV8WTE2_9CUCU|nr:hypothetical protein NQ314_017598 [Rhamnusium bicolor]
MTVQNTPKVLADKKQRQVGQIVSAEREHLVTLGVTISAIGTFIPPAYVFPRAKYQDHFINDAAEGSIGLTSKTEWINADLFLNVLKHTKKTPDALRILQFYC